MKKRFSFWLSIIGIVLTATVTASCGASYSTGNVNVSKIDELALIQPKSLIAYYDAPGHGFIDPSLSRASEQLLTDLITSRRYPFTDPVPVDYNGDGSAIGKWIDSFMDLESSDIPRLRVPKALTALIKSTGHRYGIVVHANGYIESIETYNQEKLAEFVDAVVSKVFELTKTYHAHEQAANALYTAVIDAETGRVVYFNSILSNADYPLDRGDVGGQMNRLLRKFDK